MPIAARVYHRLGNGVMLSSTNIYHSMKIMFFLVCNVW